MFHLCGRVTFSFLCYAITRAHLEDAKKHAVVNGVLMVHRGWGKDTDA
ncbi:hypothetical protein CTZ70_000740 [Escherichia coli]|nr:hypothetical protein [Escherichia coli]